MKYLKYNKVFEGYSNGDKISYNDCRDIQSRNRMVDFTEDEYNRLNKIKMKLDDNNDQFRMTLGSASYSLTSRELTKTMEPLGSVEKYDGFFLRQFGSMMNKYAGSYEASYTDRNVFTDFADVWRNLFKNR